VEILGYPSAQLKKEEVYSYVPGPFPTVNTGCSCCCCCY